MLANGLDTFNKELISLYDLFLAFDLTIFKRVLFHILDGFEIGDLAISIFLHKEVIGVGNA
jgi:hypothetical protein